MPDTKLLNSWRRRIRCLKSAHFESADLFARLNGWVGAFLIFFSALSTMFALVAAKAEDLATFFAITAAVNAMLTSTLAGFQAYFRFSERAERHRTIGAALARLELIAETSVYKSEDDQQPKPQQSSLDSLMDEWARVTSGAPVLSERRYQKYCGKLEGCDCHDT